MNKFIGIKLWAIYFGLVLFLAIAFAVILGSFWASGWAIFLPFMVLFPVSLLALIRRESKTREMFFGYYEVPSNHEAIVEVSGRYIGRPLKEGFYFLFPFFNFVFVKDVWVLADKEMDLFEGENSEVDFEDGLSAKLKSKIHYRVEDSFKASYKLDDLTMVRDKVEEGVRAYTGRKKFEECNQKDITLDSIFLDTPDVTKNISDNWGVKVLDLVVSDIELSEDDMKTRKQIMSKDVDVKVAEKEAERLVILAKAKKEVLALEGEGLSAKAQALKDKGFEENAILAFLESELKWLNLGDKTVVIDDGSGIGGVIAKLKALGL
jgi:regulator of protease activity HflC (stomatin/prohibitin superfamily)